MTRPRWIVAGLVLSMGLFADADVKLPAIFSDNMLLQKGEKTPVFGDAAPGEKVTVKVGQASGEATAGQDGTWRVVLDTREVRGAVEVSVQGANALTVKNVLV